MHLKYCGTSTDQEIIELLTVLSGKRDLILEDEMHVMMASRPRYDDIRGKLSGSISNLLQTHVEFSFVEETIKECSIFFRKFTTKDSTINQNR